MGYFLNFINRYRYYRDPDYNQITEGSTVLAKYKDELWYKGCVEDIVKDTEFSVKFLHNNDVLLLNLHSIFPLGKFSKLFSDFIYLFFHEITHRRKRI